MQIEPTPAALLPLVTALTRSFQQHARSPQLGQHLLEALLKALPTLDGAALYEYRGDTPHKLAESGSPMNGEAHALLMQARATGDVTSSDASYNGVLAVFPMSVGLDNPTHALLVHRLDGSSIAYVLRGMLQNAALIITMALSQPQVEQGESEAELAALFAAMMDVIIVYDAQGRYVRVAPTNPPLLFKPADEMVGKTLHDVLPIHTANEFHNYIKAVLTTRETLRVEYRLELNEQEHWFAATITPMSEDKVLWVARDVTDSKKIQLELKQARKQLEQRVQERTAELAQVSQGMQRAESALATEHNILRTLIDHLPDYIFVKDTEGRIVANNLAHASVIMGLESTEAAIGKTDFDYFPRSLAEQYRADEQEMMATGQPAIDVEEPSENAAGEPTWHLTTKVPLRDADGRVTGLVGIARDITERKRAEADHEYLLASEREQRKLAETLAEISLSLASRSEPDEMLDLILDYTRKLVPQCAAAAIGLLEGNALRLARWQAEHGLLNQEFFDQGHVPLDRLPLTAEVTRSGKPLIVRDVNAEPDQAAVFTLGMDWIRSYVVMPVMLRDAMMGVIWMGSAEVEAFSEDDVKFMLPLANASAIAMENNRLMQRAKSHATREEQLNIITAQMQERGDINALLNVAMQELGQTLGARVGRIRLNMPDDTSSEEQRNGA